MILANNLPKAIARAATIPFNGTVFIVGGYNNDGYISDIYQYKPGEDVWDKLSSELETPRRTHAAIIVQQSLFPECAEIP